jgi:hypothetical protein
MGLRCLALASTGLRAPDALARCHDALAMLHELRYWQKLRQTLESVALALAQAGRIEHSAVVLGHLDVHTVGFGLEHRLGFRQQARAIIDSNGDHEADTLRGARMTAEELVVAALDFCSEAPHDDITR